MADKPAPVTLTFREKIPRTNSNTVLVVPNLTYKNLVLKSIDFETEEWSFEISLKSAQTELVKLSPSFFQHEHSIDLTGYRSKLDEGDKVELYIKPKQSKKDIELMICYTYTESVGMVYYQNSERISDLADSSISSVLADLTQGMSPTRLYLKCDEPIGQVSLVPRFVGTEEVPEYVMDVGEGSLTCELDFDSEEMAEVLPLLRYYQIKIDREGGGAFGVDAQVHFMARGFKN